MRKLSLFYGMITGILLGVAITWGGVVLAQNNIEITSVDITVSDPGRYEMTILGSGFDTGEWPPVVTLNGFPFEVGNDQNPNWIIATPDPIFAPILGELLEDPDAGLEERLLVVQVEVAEDASARHCFLSSGTVYSYDCGPVFDELSDHMKMENRQGEWRVPQGPEELQHTTLSWKFGPTLVNAKRNIFGDPIYFQLTSDYEIDLQDYLDNYDRNSFRGEGIPDVLPNSDGACAPYLQEFGDLLNTYSPSWTVSDPNGDEFSLVSVTDGVLKVSRGYRWDGPSIDSPISIGPITRNTRMFPKHSSLMRATLIHDAFYDLLRVGVEPLAKGVENPLREKYRKMADCFLYMFSRQDYATFPYTWFSYVMVRLGGEDRSDEESRIWKYHAVADAGEDQTVYACASPEDGATITLDGSQSHQVLRWAWEVDGVPYTGISPDAPIVEHNLQPGKTYIAKLTVDDGDDDVINPHYLDADEVAISVIADTEAPVIASMDDIITNSPPLWPGATVRYNVPAVDNCGEPVVTCDPPSGSRFNVGQTEVECVAKDNSGNSASTSFEVKVIKSASGGGAISWVELLILFSLSFGLSRVRESGC